MSLIKHVTDSSFESDVLNSPSLTLLDFWAEWCAPCRAMNPILDALAKDLEGTLVVAKINTEENRQTPARYGIRGIPTLMLFKDGELLATQVGAVNKTQLAEFLLPHI